MFCENSQDIEPSPVLSLNNNLKTIQYYIWKNGKLSGYFVEDQISDNDTTVKMLYDDNGNAVGFYILDVRYNCSDVFYFQRNLQGDITDVYNNSGEIMMSYTYDAWGNVTVALDESSNSGIFNAYMAANYVPITYRGYMYDHYTGLYYLQSRYYNPAYGRFLNADSIMKTGEPLGANIFAYCGNNPVNFVDYDGKDAMSVITNILYLLVVAAVMKADDLVDDFGYIFEGAISFSYEETTVDGITDLVATFVLNSSEDDFESYDVNIKLAHIDVWRDWQRGMEHASYDNHYADTFVNTAFFIIGFVPYIGNMFSIILAFCEISFFLENRSTYRYIDFINTKIENADDNKLDFIYFVREIKRNYVNFFGKLKSEIVYDCTEE